MKKKIGVWKVETVTSGKSEYLELTKDKIRIRIYPDGTWFMEDLRGE